MSARNISCMSHLYIQFREVLTFFWQKDLNFIRRVHKVHSNYPMAQPTNTAGKWKALLCIVHLLKQGLELPMHQGRSNNKKIHHFHCCSHPIVKLRVRNLDTKIFLVNNIMKMYHQVANGILNDLYKSLPLSHCCRALSRVRENIFVMSTPLFSK